MTAPVEAAQGSPSVPAAAIVLAAGEGKRMKSPRAKVALEAAGRPLVAWVVEAARAAGVGRVVVVVGHGRAEVERLLGERFGDTVKTAVQQVQRGTGDAVRCGLEALGDFEGRVVILYGDCPLMPAETIARLIEASHAATLALVTGRLGDPASYGRIIRDDDDCVIAIREERDCTPAEREIAEVNPGLYAVDAAFLRSAIARLRTDNAQGELYLTDVVAMAAAEGSVRDVPGDMSLLRGVNDRIELAFADRMMRKRIAEELARAGVAIRDPDRVYIDADAVVEPEAEIAPDVHLRGRCVVRAGARIDVGCVLTDVEVGPGAELRAYTVAAASRIGANAKIGPFAHLRPDTELAAEVHIGNFVETKKTTMGRGSKANHLAYLGDGQVGEDVNVGAGTIFCNYDGVRKNVTTLEDGVFIGSDSQLIAPVTVGKGAYVASGTTVSRDVPANALAISRPRQENKEGYADKLRQRFAAEKKKEGG